MTSAARRRSFGLSGWIRTIAVALVVCLLAGRQILAQQAGGEHWVGTWATAEVGRPQNPPSPTPPLPPLPGSVAPAPPAQVQQPAPFVHFNNQTLRQIVHTSIGGARVRVVLSNAFGTVPLTIGAAHIALREKDSAIAPASDRALTFSGQPTIAIPAGAVLFSDPVSLAVPPMGDLAVDLYLPGDTNNPSPLTMHNGARQTSYVSQTGNHAGTAALPVVATTQSWFLLSRVEVMAPEPVGAVVTFGDSITDGSASTPDGNNRWPDQLARRLMAQAGTAKMAVLNAGIGGNRVLTDAFQQQFQFGINALARFDRQALEQTGVTHIIVLEGINDIGTARLNPMPTAEDIIAGHKQLVERAHTRGLKIFGATLTPFEGSVNYTQVGEAKRQAINQWIRTSRAYDGVVDFDAATRDPNNPARLLPQFDSGDRLHPSDAGYQAMANAIDLELFKGAQAIRRVTVR